MNFVYTFKNYRCNKRCPYCITKILRKRSPEDIDQLKQQINNTRGDLDTFVLSGNGEPSLYSTQDLITVRDMAVASSRFDDYRIQTSGALFHDRHKLRLFDGWLKEITIIDIDEDADMKIMRHRMNFMTLAKRADRVRVNIVITNENKDYVPEWIDELLMDFETVAIKILDGDNPWIVENALPWSASDDYVKFLSKELNTTGVYNTEQRRFVWEVQGKKVTMSSGKETNPDHIQIEMV